MVQIGPQVNLFSNKLSHEETNFVTNIIIHQEVKHRRLMKFSNALMHSFINDSRK